MFPSPSSTILPTIHALLKGLSNPPGLAGLGLVEGANPSATEEKSLTLYAGDSNPPAIEVPKSYPRRGTELEK